MSTTETTEQTAVLCPGCAGPLEPMQTICAGCRSALEEQVLAVRAADYPALFHNVVRNSAEPHRDPVDPTSMDMLKAAENTSDDLDLVPLVPMDEPRKPGNGAGESASGNSAPAAAASAVSMPVSTASTVAVASSPGPVVSHAPVTRPPHVYTPPSAPKLEPSSRWKHVVIAVGSLVAAAGLAALLWSTLVPSRPGDAADDTTTKAAAK